MDNLSKDIIKEWNLGSLSKEEQKVALENIGKMIYQAILVRSLDILSDGEEEELDTLLDKDTTTMADALAFLKKKIPSFDKLVREEISSARQSFLLSVS